MDSFDTLVYDICVSRCISVYVVVATLFRLAKKSMSSSEVIIWLDIFVAKMWTKCKIKYFDINHFNFMAFFHNVSVITSLFHSLKQLFDHLIHLFEIKFLWNLSQFAMKCSQHICVFAFLLDLVDNVFLECQIVKILGWRGEKNEWKIKEI